jgi:orotate phosphoribosyltransferase
MRLSISDVEAVPAHRLLQQPDDRRRELAQDIGAAAYIRGSFVLRSGDTSDYYLDKYLFETRPTVLRRLADLLGRRVPEDVVRIAGLAVGAVAVAAAVSLETGLPFVIIRASAREHGGRARIEGELHPDERVTVIEDVVSTGGGALAAAETLRAAGASVSGVLAVVDRCQGARESIESAGLAFDSLFTIDELRRAAK